MHHEVLMSDITLQTALIIGVGVLGCIIPMLPGPPLVWLGMLYYAWRTNWEQVGWPALALLFALMMVGATSNFWLSYFGARKSGASVWASVAAFFGGLIGLVVASLPGLLLGALGAIAAVEYFSHRDWKKVLRAGGGYLAGYLLSVVVELLVCLLMILIFLAAVRL